MAFNLATPQRALRPLLGRRRSTTRSSTSTWRSTTPSTSASPAASQRFEGGAGGDHKLARGFEPAETWSCHALADPRLDAAVRRHLESELTTRLAGRGALACRAPAPGRVSAPGAGALQRRAQWSRTSRDQVAPPWAAASGRASARSPASRAGPSAGPTSERERSTASNRPLVEPLDVRRTARSAAARRRRGRRRARAAGAPGAPSGWRRASRSASADMNGVAANRGSTTATTAPRRSSRAASRRPAPRRSSGARRPAPPGRRRRPAGRSPRRRRGPASRRPAAARRAPPAWPAPARRRGRGARLRPAAPRAARCRRRGRRRAPPAPPASAAEPRHQLGRVARPRRVVGGQPVEDPAAVVVDGDPSARHGATLPPAVRPGVTRPLDLPPGVVLG